MKFLDEAKIYVRSGDGGAGCLSFRREKNIARGGPNGGNGGRGGSVYARAVEGLNTLIDFRFRSHFKAKNGRPGSGANRSGAAAADLVIPVPQGTQFLDDEALTVLFDLTAAGQQALLAEGGDGGFGNAHFKSATNRSPRRADAGRPGTERRFNLRLKLIADAGIVGLPNAGKSTFLGAVTRAKPKIAGYPFTTLTPQLGVVAIASDEIVLADIPGLIEGAHAGAGLGDRFLGHIERCGVLLHLVDGGLDDTAGRYRAVRDELAAYGHGLADKREIVALNKCDLLSAEAMTARRGELAGAAGAPVLALSAASGWGRDGVLHELLAAVQEWRDASAAATHDDRRAGGSRP